MKFVPDSHLAVLGRIALFAALVCATLSVSGQVDQDVYSDSLENGWQNWSWASVDFYHGNTVHSGSRAIGVNAGAWQALSFWHPAQDASLFTNFSFWIHGGTSGGQPLQVYAETQSGGSQPAVPIPAPAAGTWQLVTVSFDSLGVAGEPDLTRISIQNASGATLSTFYVDDVSLATGPPDTVPPVVQSVNPAAGIVSALTTVVVTFSEPVTGVNASDLRLNGNPAVSLSGGGHLYTFTFLQPPEGIITASWDPAHGITDLVGLPFDGSGSWQYTLADVDPPVVSLLFPAEGATLASLGQVEVTFDETVLGVEASDLLINGVPATNVVKLPAGPYVFRFAQPTAGFVSMAWAAEHGITDDAASANHFAGGTWSYTLDPNLPMPDLVITEILAANVDTNGLVDEDGQLQDWIEIHNRGTQTVDLSNWSLSDDAALPGLWPFPARNLAPGEYLVVFASGKDRKPVVGELHTSFKLSLSGEHLGLYTPDSPRTFVSGFQEYPEQRNDTSYGTDGAGQLRYFATPTPGTANGASTIVGVVAPVHVNVERGCFANPFELFLSCETRAVTFRFTTDGSEPSASSPVFPGSLTISDTTLFRAAAFKADHLPSRTGTHSYLFHLPASVRSLPILSIVTGTNQLWGPTGILGIHGGAYVNDVWTWQNPGDYHNPTQHGIAWERPTSVEWIEPEDNGGFQVDCGIRVQGSDYNRERSTPSTKYSFRLYFRGDYGPGRLEYPLFPLTTVDRFDGLVLRAGFNEQGNPFIRDELHRRLSHDMGQIASHGNMAVVFVNGEYHTGSPFYNPCERIHEEFMQEHLGGGDEWDVIKPVWQDPNAVDGTFDDMYALETFVSSTADVNDPGDYAAIGQWLDLTNFVDYLILNTYAGMGDWPGNNWRAGRDIGANGIWRFVVWDAEWGMGIYDRQPTGPDAINNFTSGLTETWATIPRLYQSLRDSAEFRLLWADRVQKHFSDGGALTPAHITGRIDELKQELSALIPYMDPGMENWVQVREPVFFNQMESEGLLSSVEAPAFGQHGGRVGAGFELSMSAPAGTIYYTTDGSDPREMFSGNISDSAAAYSIPLPLNASVAVKARARQGTAWSALTEATFQLESLGIPLRITEIMYNPVGGALYEFIELENLSAADVDLSGMYFEGIEFTFLEGSTLAAGSRLVLGSNKDTNAWTMQYPGVTAGGWFAGNLDNGGERISLWDSDGRIITSVDYDDGNGWPERPDGEGASLEVLDANGAPDDPANWQASGPAHGTPGGVNSAPPIQPVYLNEVMADNVTAVNHAGTHPDWVEIRNEGASPVDLSDWSLSDDGNQRKFVFPADTVVPASGYLVVWCDAVTNMTPGLHAGFSLDNDGETVSLYDPATTRIDAVSYGLQIPDLSVGRIGGEWMLNNPTLSNPNVAATLGGASNLGINEWMADAAPGADDWLELYNRSATLPVSIQGIYLGNGNEFSRLAALSFLRPRGYMQIRADEGVGPDHVDFRLSGAGGILVLYDSTGAELESVEYGLQTESVSEGRLPDGNSNVMSFPGTASPGTTNHVASYSGPVINEVLARNTQVDVGGGAVADYVELWNPAGSAFDLGGMSLSVNKAKAGAWVFPSPTVLSGGAYLLIRCDGSLIASTNPVSFNLGDALDGESGGVYLFNAAGQLVDSVDYGLQTKNRSIGLDGGQWKLLSLPTPGTANASASALGANTGLVINEWMANPADGADWFELYNPQSLPVDLSTIALSDDPSLVGEAKFLPDSLSFIGAGGFVKWVADAEPGDGRNHVNFRLDGQGDSLLVYGGDGSGSFSLIDSVAFGAQSAGISVGSLPDGSTSVIGFPGSASPGASNYRLLTDVVINEILTHTDPPFEDAIELHNPTSGAMDVGGWYISNSRDHLKKFQIPGGVTIPAGGFTVIYEYQFNSGGTNAFDLNSAHGDEVWLSKAPGGVESGDRTFVEVGAAFNGASFGRFVTSDSVDYPALTQTSFGVSNPGTLTEFRTGAGGPNAIPVVGPMILNELLYNPPGGTNGSHEYIELHNNSDNSVPLFDPLHPTNRWTLGGGIDYLFPAGISLEPGEYLIVVDFDPVLDPTVLAAFRGLYGISTNIEIYGPFSGNLNNEGDEVGLYRPDTPQSSGPDAGFVPYVLVDRVAYDNVWPWPIGWVEGGGHALQRSSPMLYGNEPLNWFGGVPSPGMANSLPTEDTDADGIPDLIEIGMGLDPDNPDDGAEDPDQDGASNYEEYVAGTGHLDPGSNLHFIRISVGANTMLTFEAVATKTYSILYKDALLGDDWTKLSDVSAPSVNQITDVIDTSAGPTRLYILVTPAVP